MSQLPPIVLIDEDADDRELVSLVLRGAFGEVRILEVANAADLARVVSEGRFGLVLTEYAPGFIRASDVLRLIRDLRPDSPVLVLTRAPADQVAAELLHLAPDGLVPKTSSGLTSLPQAMRTALHRLRRRRAAAGPDARLQLLFDALPVGVFTASPGGTLLDANPRFAALLGFKSAEECTQRPLAGFFVEPEAAEAWRAGLGGGTERAALDVTLRRADGTEARLSLTSWLSAPGGPGEEEIQGVLEERAPASDAGRPGTGDETAYVVSHDLRQPVTQVVRYLELLQGEAAEKLGDSGRELYAQARRGARRIETMLDALLRCARVESQGEAFAETDVSAVVARVVARLVEAGEAPAGAVRAEPLPQLRCDAGQVEQLFQNLLANAFKFRRGDPPRVVIGAEDDGDHWRFFCRDNGIGIDPKDAERIFGMFQRLHTETEIPGTGIGLALCRRIVARHGGRIWVESQPGEGSTFRFTLAKHPRPQGERGLEDR